MGVAKMDNELMGVSSQWAYRHREALRVRSCFPRSVPVLVSDARTGDWGGEEVTLAADSILGLQHQTSGRERTEW